MGFFRSKRSPSGVRSVMSAASLQISISTPVRIGEGIGAYVSYVVTSRGLFDGAEGVRDVNRRRNDITG